jgi:hypothetical protein
MIIKSNTSNEMMHSTIANYTLQQDINEEMHKNLIIRLEESIARSTIYHKYWKIFEELVKKADFNTNIRVAAFLCLVEYMKRSILFRESAVRTHNGDTEAEAAVRLVSEEGDSMHTRFLQSPQAYDSFLTSVARDVRDARINRTPIKRFHVPNTDDSTGLGFHWVSAVYEIKQKRV